MKISTYYITNMILNYVEFYQQIIRNFTKIGLLDNSFLIENKFLLSENCSIS